MGTWLFVLLSLALVALSAGKSMENENAEPCASSNCARKRALQLSTDENFSEKVARSSEAEKSCITWECKREMLLRKKFMNALRDAETAQKKSSVLDPAETPCITWTCRRKRRAVPQSTQPESTQIPQLELPADEEPCLTRDCRTGKKRSLVKRSLSNDKTTLMEKLRLVAQAQLQRQRQRQRRSDPGCIVWHCNGKRR